MEYGMLRTRHVSRLYFTTLGVPLGRGSALIALDIPDFMAPLPV
jgi:hypothetical protein